MYKIQWIFGALILMICYTSFAKDFENIKAPVSVSLVDLKEDDKRANKRPEAKILKGDKTVKVKRKDKAGQIQQGPKVLSNDLPRGNSK